MHRRMLILALILVAAACAPAGSHWKTMAKLEGSSCVAPDGRCDYDDECCSRVCDAHNCRGPMPGPVGP